MIQQESPTALLMISSDGSGNGAVFVLAIRGLILGKRREGPMIVRSREWDEATATGPLVDWSRCGSLSREMSQLPWNFQDAQQLSRSSAGASCRPRNPLLPEAPVRTQRK